MDKALQVVVRWSDDPAPEGEILFAGEVPTVPRRGEGVHISNTAGEEILHEQVDAVIHVLKDPVVLVLLRRPRDPARRRAPLGER